MYIIVAYIIYAGQCHRILCEAGASDVCICGTNLICGHNDGRADGYCVLKWYTHTHEICVYTISIHDTYYACVYKRNMDRRRATECSTIHNARASRTSWLNSPGCRAMPPIHTTIHEYYIANDIIHFYCVKRDTAHRRTVASRQLLMLRRICATIIR